MYWKDCNGSDREYSTDDIEWNYVENISSELFTDLSAQLTDFYPQPLKGQEWIDSKGYSIQTMKNVILSLCNGEVCIRHTNSKHICKFWTSWYTKNVN